EALQLGVPVLGRPGGGVGGLPRKGLGELWHLCRPFVGADLKRGASGCNHGKEKMQRRERVGKTMQPGETQVVSLEGWGATITPCPRLTSDTATPPKRQARGARLDRCG